MHCLIACSSPIYCKCIIFSVYDIWHFSDFLLFSVDLIWWLIYIHLNAHLAVDLILRGESTEAEITGEYNH